MTDRELMQQALDAFEFLQTDIHWQYKSPTRAMLRKIELALRARLAQPEREWHGLTEDEKREIFNSCEREDRGYVAAMVEAKLREKNA